MIQLLSTRRFGPLFAVQFLTAYNDNLFRFGLLFYLTYGLMVNEPDAAAQLVTVAGGLFILPFALFSGLAGQIADAVCKARTIRIIKIAEIVIMGFGVWALWLQSVPFMLFVLFCRGLQSTFFGPIKYAILPQHLKDSEITGGTALIEAGTYTAILTGQLSGGIVTPEILMVGVIVVAAVGIAGAWAVPAAPPVVKAPCINWNPFVSSWHVLRRLYEVRALWYAALCGSWFWLLGIVFTTLFIPLVRGTIGGTEGVANLFVACFSIGVAIGSLAIGRYLGPRITAKTLPLSMLLMSVAAIDLYFAIHAYADARVSEELVSAMTFLAAPEAWRIAVDLTAFAMAGGSLVVPLYAILVARSDAAERAKTIAAYNIMNSSFMVIGALGAGALLTAGLDVSEVLLAAGLVNLAVIWAAWKLNRLLQAAPHLPPERV
ncbi:MAG: MFS transporter [Pacificimonas sp.]|jgi:acyl-[acyl-carrier-protein]-phospholipid O-acyltransferase/long-chain-fatty-acid--[acyl-carrier-protein] ligase|nr:MFS transporter [Pacificimonas sp.]